MPSKRRRTRRADPLDWDWLLLPYDAFVAGLRAAGSALRKDARARWGLLILLAALGVRLLRPDWYATRLFHPDERWIFDKVAELHLWAEPGKNDAAGMQYGSLPLYAVSVFKDALHALTKLGPHQAAVLCGRTLTGVVDSVTVLGALLLAAEFVGLGWALLAAGLVAGAPLHIQLAHFFTVDPWLACFATWTLWACVRLARRPSLGASVWVGVLYAAALASKSSGLPLVLPIVLAHLWSAFSPALPARQRPAALKRAGLGLGVAALACVAAFFIFMPWAFLNFSKFYANQTAQQGILVKGEPGGVPFVRQYWDTGFGFHLKNIMVFYLGLPGGLLALLAVPFLAWMGLRDALRAWRPVVAPRASALPAASAWERAFGPLLLLAWVLPYFAVVGSSFAKFARYMLPILPALSVLLALGLAALARKYAAWARGLAWLVGLFALGHGLGYALTYTRQHPWLEASVWTFTHVPPTVAAEGGRPTRVLNEDWGDDLPVDVERIPSLRYEQLKGRPGQVNIVEWDSANKLQRLSQSLSDADIIMLADPRAYGTYLRLPLRFPLTHAYYDLLFNDPGRLGFELAHEASNPIKVFGLFPLPDSRIPKVPRWLWADESFTLYDRPHTFIFRRVAPRTPEEQRRVLLERVKELGGSEEFLLGRSPDELQRRALSRVSGGAAGDSVGIPAAGDINPNFGRSRGALRPLLQPVLTWWLLVTVLGWLALPLAVRVFSAWPAGGYPLSKALGVLLFGYLAYQLAEWRWLPFTQAGLWLLLVLLAVGASLLLHRRRAEARAWFQAHRREIFASEAVFAAAFLFFVVVRLYNPNIHDIVGQGYFGGGEPLGMTYLSSVTRCVSFPAYDPWLALHNSSYYYFGYVLVAALTKLSGFPPSITYNLSLALFFSLTLLSAYGLLRAFAARRRLALAGAAMVALAGSLWSVAYIAIQVHRGFSPFSALFSHGFIWDPTRFPELVNGHIFEFPYFSYLYGDLHPHNMVVAFSLLLLALLAVPFLAREGGWRSAGATPAAAGLWLGLTALLLDVQYALNTWSWPVFVALSLGALLVGPWAGKGLRPGQAFVAAFSGLGAWLAALLLGRLLMHGFREWFLQSGTARLGRVLPQEWQMSAYIPLAFFLPGLAALAILGGARLRAYAAAQAKGLGWERLARRDWLDRSLSVLERLFERRLLFALAATAGLFLVGGLLAWAAFKFQTQGVLALALGLGLAAFGLFLLRAWEDGTESFLWLLGAFTCFLVAGSERWFVADRMNTIFKFWFNGWILMGVVFGIGLARVWGSPASAAAALPRRFGRGRGPSGRRAPRLNLLRLLPWFGALGLALLLFGAAFIDAKRLSLGGRFGVSFGVLALLLLGLFGGSAFAGTSAWWRAAQRGVWGGLLALGLLYPLGATLARIHEASQFKHPHLDGLLFMQERVARGGYDAKDYDADDYALIRWLNEHADVTETLLEAPGIEMYKGFSRYSIYTGLPTLLGWDYQVGQQLGERTGGILTQRRRDAALIYTGSPEQARELLKKYRVRWIVVGGIERQLYGGPGLEKFDSLAELVASSGPSKLYRFAWDKP